MQLHESGKALADELGSLFIEIFHYLALFVIGASIVWSAMVAYGGMMLQGHATIGDILLLFIYLELGAMVGSYLKTNLMPVRCLIYIASLRWPDCRLAKFRPIIRPIWAFCWFSARYCCRLWRLR